MMPDENHTSPDGIEFPNPTNSENHPDVAPIYVSPSELEKETTQNPYNE